MRKTSAHEIRHPKRDETSKLVTLGVETGLFSEDEANALLRDTLDAFHSHALGTGHRVLVAEHLGEPLGWVYFAPKEAPQGVWDLWWIGVAPKHHGTGVGSALLLRVEQEVRAAAGRLLLIETSALPKLASTRAFYARRGYRECGAVPNFYASGDGKVTFAKTLA
jgi:GNAT superfamily N-acetyltransferase